METNIIISGVGGQGNLLASQILAKAAMNRGYRVRIGETHGMAQRGGAVTSHVRIGDVYGALVPEGRCDYLLGFEPVEALRQIRYMKKDGVAVVNEKPVVPVTVSIGDAVYPDPEKREERKEILKKMLNVDKIGINAKNFSYEAYRKLKEITKAEIVDVSGALSKARLVKEKDEIEKIKKACNIVSEVCEEIKSYIKEGIKEYELSAELTYLMMKKGATEPSFTNICSFGENAAEPHYTAGDRVLKKGDYVLLDFGARYRRYISDITRTFVYGKAEEKQREIYETVKKAQEIGFENLKAGVKGGDVHNAVENFINSTKYKGRFIHALGHSIGLLVHDGYGLHPSIDLTLEENMIFTVEPGIYIPGYGGVRIEDDVLIKKDGIEILTKAPKDFTEL